MMITQVVCVVVLILIVADSIDTAIRIWKWKR